MAEHTEIESRISFRPRGGQNGIEVSTYQQTEFAAFMGSKYRDEFIPLPDTLNQEQKDKVEGCEHVDAEYWENEEGSHGWCCSKCGKVIQWG